MSIAFWLSLAASYAFIAYCMIGFFGIVAHCRRGEIDTAKLLRRAETGRMFLDALVWPYWFIRTFPQWYDAPVCAMYYFVQARRKKPYRTRYQKN